ncbi:MAG: sugar phosphate isomerase/epimerase [Clostridia bacterium]|nr:sugar phosphate isomerase/epimerase [Clostridia bacterium]
MKISITSYSYGQSINRDGFTIFDAMRHAKTIADGFEFSGIPTPEGKDPVEFAAEIKAFADSIDLPIVCYAIGANLMEEDLDAEVQRVCREVDVAAALGAPVMRHDVAWGFPAWYKGLRTFEAVLPRLAEGCRRITEYAAAKGIRTCSENHGHFVQDSDRIVALINAVNHPNYGALCDLGNFLCADDVSNIAVGKVAPLAFHVHAKDFLVKEGKMRDPGAGWFRSRGGTYLRGTIIGHGEVPVEQDLWILKNAGYDGYVTVEFEGSERCPDAIVTGAENLKRYISNL